MYWSSYFRTVDQINSPLSRALYTFQSSGPGPGGWLTIVCVILLQSLLAALGSIQFVSNIAFAYVVLNKTISVKYVYSNY